MKNTGKLAQVAAILTALFWGFSFIWTKQVLEYFDPIDIIFMRLVIASIVLLLVSFILKINLRFTKKEYLQLALLALFQPFLYFIFEGYGIKLTSSSISSVIISTIPLFIPIGAYIFFKEKLNALNIAGLLLSFIGILVILNKKSGILTRNFWGIVFLFLAIITAVCYMMILRKLASNHNVFALNIYQNIFGILFFIPFVIKDFGSIIKTPLASQWITPLVLLGVLSSAVAFVLFTYAVDKLGPSKTAAFNNLIPVFATILAYFIIKEDISLQKIVGITIVLTGVLLSQKKSNKKEA